MKKLLVLLIGFFLAGSLLAIPGCAKKEESGKPSASPSKTAEKTPEKK